MGHDGSRAPEAGDVASLAPAHAVYFRHETLRALMRDSDVVARGTVIDIAPYAPITAQDAGAAADAPAIPRRLVTFRTDQQLHGSHLGGSFEVIEALPPRGTYLEESPPYGVGEEAVVFLRSAFGPRGRPERSGAFFVVGVDARYRVQRTGELRAGMAGAPVEEVRAALRDPERFQEAAQR